MLFWYPFNRYFKEIKQSAKKDGKNVNDFLGWVTIPLNVSLATCTLKHKDSFGKSEKLSKIFFAEILVFDHDYEGKSSSSNGLLWISFIFLK